MTEHVVDLSMTWLQMNNFMLVGKREKADGKQWISRTKFLLLLLDSHLGSSIEDKVYLIDLSTLRVFFVFSTVCSACGRL